jgi:hypothetical protein
MSSWLAGRLSGVDVEDGSREELHVQQRACEIIADLRVIALAQLYVSRLSHIPGG